MKTHRVGDFQKSSARYLLLPLFLSTAASLLIYITSGISLPISLAIILLIAITIFILVWRRTNSQSRLDLVKVVRVGVVCGLAATVIYDLSRFILIELTEITFSPFEAFPLFGKALVGSSTPEPWILVAGFTYHIFNGIGFAVTYALLFGHKGIFAGILWSFSLELVMVSVYPGWLDLKALDEFLQVSVFGHVFYGAVLGYMSKSLLERKKQKDPYWFVSLPLASRRISDNLETTLSDGHFLTIFPLVATILPPIAALSGFLIGWQHLGFDTVFSESLPLMTFAVMLGILSGNLGFLFVAGFALGDFFLAQTDWAPFLTLRIPLLIEYSLLAIVTTKIPVITKLLLAQLPPPQALSRNVRFILAILGHVSLTSVMVYLWTQIVPLLIRPVFTWSGGQPTVSAVSPLQDHGIQLVIVAGLISLLRISLQGLTAFHMDHQVRLDAVEERLRAGKAITPLSTHIPLPFGILIQTMVQTLLFAGILQSWLDALLLSGVMFTLNAARSRLIPVPLGPWPVLIEKIPALFRLIVGFIVIFFVTNIALEERLLATDSFHPVVIQVIFALIVIFLLMPGLPKEQSVGGKNS